MGCQAAATAYTADMDALFSPEAVTVLMVDDDAELAAMVKAGRMALRGVDNAFEDSMRQVMGRLQADAPTEA